MEECDKLRFAAILFENNIANVQTSQLLQNFSELNFFYLYKFSSSYILHLTSQSKIKPVLSQKDHYKQHCHLLLDNLLAFHGFWKLNMTLEYLYNIIFSEKGANLQAAKLDITFETDTEKFYNITSMIMSDISRIGKHESHSLVFLDNKVLAVFGLIVEGCKKDAETPYNIKYRDILKLRYELFHRYTNKHVHVNSVVTSHINKITVFPINDETSLTCFHFLFDMKILTALNIFNKYYMELPYNLYRLSYTILPTGFFYIERYEKKIIIIKCFNGFSKLRIVDTDSLNAVTVGADETHEHYARQGAYKILELIRVLVGIQDHKIFGMGYRLYFIQNGSVMFNIHEIMQELEYKAKQRIFGSIVK